MLEYISCVTEKLDNLKWKSLDTSYSFLFYVIYLFIIINILLLLFYSETQGWDGRGAVNHVWKSLQGLQ